MELEQPIFNSLTAVEFESNEVSLVKIDQFADDFE